MPRGAIYSRTEYTPGMSSEERGAVRALRLLRRQARTESRVYRAATMAEAEANARDTHGADLAMLREHALTGHCAAVAQTVCGLPRIGGD